MIDMADRYTMTLTGIKEPVKRGRPPKFSEAMSPAQRKAKQRRAQDDFIVDNDPSLWSESDCMRVMSAKKFSSYHQFAWERLGQIKGYAAS
ncbi:hypothetical protein [Neptuniibacter caesariensis]|uniref:Uncharacterized protein n=1 Tax=Neptuniibacter caesariensis TaxID=207954 RepID=A0A7U8GT44_NEPCE|nr:hypothetical protein [Neptuniibacter caesariensis]EAR62051.1 hypothetical protein MED92_10109 [Oceanospirillum sp. MED92] [Neptuniibacter caesariensis]